MWDNDYSMSHAWMVIYFFYEHACTLFCVWSVNTICFSLCQVMNAARIHDKQKLRSFWERRIVQHSEQMLEEENRMRSSSLTRSAVKLLLLLLCCKINVQDVSYSTLKYPNSTLLNWAKLLFLKWKPNQMQSLWFPHLQPHWLLVSTLRCSPP